MKYPNVHFRQGTYDESIWESVYTLNEYNIPDSLLVNTGVIDIGAHIGSFSRLALDRGAMFVQAFEPWHENFTLLRKNLEGYSNFTARMQPVFHKPGVLMGYTPSVDSNNTGGGNFVVSDGQQDEMAVVSTCLDHILSSAPDGVERIILKMDCEGAEYPVLYTTNVGQTPIELIVGEYHSYEGGIPPESVRTTGIYPYHADGLKQYLIDQGYKVSFTPTAANLGHFRAVKGETFTL